MRLITSFDFGFLSTCCFGPLRSSQFSWSCSSRLVLVRTSCDVGASPTEAGVCPRGLHPDRSQPAHIRPLGGIIESFEDASFYMLTMFSCLCPVRLSSCPPELTLLDSYLLSAPAWLIIAPLNYIHGISFLFSSDGFVPGLRLFQVKSTSCSSSLLTRPTLSLTTNPVSELLLFIWLSADCSCNLLVLHAEQ